MFCRGTGFKARKLEKKNKKKKKKKRYEAANSAGEQP